MSLENYSKNIYDPYGAQNQTFEIGTFGVKANTVDNDMDVDQIVASENSLSADHLEERSKIRYQLWAFIYSFLIIYGAIDYMNNPSNEKEHIEDDTRISLTNPTSFDPNTVQIFEDLPSSQFSDLLGPGEAEALTFIDENGEEIILQYLVSSRRDIRNNGQQQSDTEEEQLSKITGYGGANVNGGYVINGTLNSPVTEGTNLGRILNYRNTDVWSNGEVNLPLVQDYTENNTPYLILSNENATANSNGSFDLPFFYDSNLEKFFLPSELTITVGSEEEGNLRTLDPSEYYVTISEDGTYNILYSRSNNINILAKLTPYIEEGNPVSNIFNPNDSLNNSEEMNEMIENIIDMSDGDLDIENLRTHFASNFSYSLLPSHYPGINDLTMDEFTNTVFRNLLAMCTYSNITFADLLDEMRQRGLLDEGNEQYLLTQATGHLVNSFLGISYMGPLNSHIFGMNNSGIVDATANKEMADDIYTRTYLNDLREFYEEMSGEILSMEDLEEIIENFNENLEEPDIESEIEENNESENNKSKDSNKALILTLKVIIGGSMLAIGRKLYKQTGKIDTRKLKVLVAANLFYNAEIMSKLYDDPELYKTVANRLEVHKRFSNTDNKYLSSLPQSEEKFSYKPGSRNPFLSTTRKQNRRHARRVDYHYNGVKSGKIKMEDARNLPNSLNSEQ